MWIAKNVNRTLNPILTNTIDAISELYKLRSETDIPLWESRVDHSSNIVDCVCSPLLASLQRAWATIICRDPDLQKGDWVIYSNAETPGKTYADQAYTGAAEVLEAAAPDGTEVPVNWYTAPSPSNKLVLDNPENGENWHLLKK